MNHAKTQSKVKTTTLLILFISISVFSCQNSTKTIKIIDIEFENNEIIMNVGETQKLEVIISPENATNQNIQWNSSDNSVASVSDGIVTALSPGDVTISATINDLSISCYVIIYDQSFYIGNTQQWEESIEQIRYESNKTRYNIIITADFTATGNNYYTFGDRENIEVNISGNHIISFLDRDGLLAFWNGQKVVITDTALRGSFEFSGMGIVILRGVETTFTLQGNASIYHFGDRAPAVRIEDNAIFYLKDNATIYDVENAVLVYERAKFYMTGGEIYACRIGIQLSGWGTEPPLFEMTGGLITGIGTNAVELHNGEFYMIDGTISHSGRGVWGISNFNMINGIITENRGEGVYLTGPSSFTMENGTISNNMATAVLISQRGTFEMNDGIIKGNRANLAAGVMIQFSSSFVMSGGIIYGSEDTGVNPELANNHISLRLAGVSSAVYGDGSDILPHTEGEQNFTNYTIFGQNNMESITARMVLMK